MMLQCRWISREDMKAAVGASYSGAQYDSEFSSESTFETLLRRKLDL